MKGIDISAHQPSIDFARIKATEIEVVYIKATEGVSYVNPLLKSQYQGAKNAGLHIGFYHFFNPAADARQQAQSFVNTVQGMDYDCRLALDIEMAGASKAALSSAAKVFLDEVQRLAGPVVVYTYTSFANESLDNTLSGYPVWIADYRSGQPGSNQIWQAWIGWQYSDSGVVPGVTGKVDLDEFTNDILTEEAILMALINQDTAGNLIKQGQIPTWGTQTVQQAQQLGLITQAHNPNEIPTIGTLLAILLNAKNKGVTL